MHEMQMERWTHRHTFGTQDVPRGESRTRWVIGLTVVMMVVEIAAGWAFGSMALLADGWHMGTHAAALSVTARLPSSAYCSPGVRSPMDQRSISLSTRYRSGPYAVRDQNP